eukprot:CAMPEP_0176465112 /NCGR_PEP_ID=MMETSP0127-20121128/37002_1 /TAXON_ID=938130 /ORGANISM="Platyophrya macrostoma, Strain WH" /LENGTH=60 /DNA_ID=CAMNT_0017857825 /DNA_START=40 /DNA_END=218 /DNA_ORIENTATION=-
MSQPVVTQQKLNQWMNNKRWLQVITSEDSEWKGIMNFFGIDSQVEAEMLTGYRPVYNVNP